MKKFTGIIKDCGPPVMVQWEFLRETTTRAVVIPRAISTDSCVYPMQMNPTITLLARVKTASMI